MSTFIQKFQNPKIRRQFLVIASGTLILLSLAAGQFLHTTTLKDLLMIAAALIAGADIAGRALISLRNKHISIELLVTIATIGALVIGEYWEAAAVTFLFIFGAYLEARTLSQTRQVLQGLLDLAPTTVIVLRDGRQLEVDPMEVELGELVLFKPGSKIAVDGVVVEGHSAVDESAITGESMPEDKEVGSRVFAGTVNQDGLLKVEATGVGADTTLARIIRRVEEAQDEKAPTQRFIEKFAQWYTPFIIALSIASYIITRDIELALTLLVIGCPGALVISTPVSVVAGIGRAAKNGILIKGGEYLENVGKVSVLAVDKTGTLTEGKPTVTDVIALLPILQLEKAGSAFPSDSRMDYTWDASQSEVLRWAAIAEAGSEHPLAKAVLQAAKKLGDVPEASDFDTCTGRGVRAFFNGVEIAVGSQGLMTELEIPVPEEAQEHLLRLKTSGKTTVLVSYDGKVAGIIAIADKPRENAKEVIARLKEIGLQKVVMLTGDDARTAQAIATELGINDVRSQLLPEEKLQVIRDLQKAGHVVAMVGDGINDAPALAAANIGIAMGAAGTDIAIETADVALMADDLMKIPEAIRISKATLRNIHQNVWIALLTVTILLLGVIFGKVHMAGGMLIHEASVLVVILNGMRLLRDAR
ncbi:MAG: heavy metal translocating P-type ATPase [Anaerolineaceae bacterium]